MNHKYISGDAFFSIPDSELFRKFPTHKAWNIYKFILEVREDPFNNYTLLTHNSDWSVSKVLETVGINKYNIPYNLNWFAQNCDVESENIFPIPIGLENEHWHSYKRKAMEDCKKKDHEYEHLCIAMFNINTNPRRPKILEHFKKIKGVYAEDTINGISFYDYVDKLASSSFCICPEGNGIDTHRLWEALYIGCVPIIEKNYAMSYTDKMLVVQVDSFFDITYDTFEDIEKEAMNKLKYLNSNNLTFKYWHDLIVGSINR